MGPDLPLFIIGCAVLLYLIASKPFEILFKKMKIMQDEEEWKLDENLGTYFDCVDPWTGKCWYTKTIYNTQKLDCKVMNSWEKDQLSKITANKKLMKEPCNYEMLSNYKYAKMF
jgi:hypothetical protein